VPASGGAESCPMPQMAGQASPHPHGSKDMAHKVRLSDPWVWGLNCLAAAFPRTGLGSRGQPKWEWLQSEYLSFLYSAISVTHSEQLFQ
jgi:hypothetical protein